MRSSREPARRRARSRRPQAPPAGAHAPARRGTAPPPARRRPAAPAPAALGRLAPGHVPLLAAELRDLMVDTVSRTGGHLGPSLGVVETTLAIHRVFDSPRDKVVWDTGHQSYVHKLVTGRRRAAFETLRQRGGRARRPGRGRGRRGSA